MNNHLLSSRTHVELIFCLIMVGVSFGAARGQSLSPHQQQEDLTVLRTHLEGMHPGLYTYHPKAAFDSLFQVIASRTKIQSDAMEFYRQLLPLLPLIANVHTKIHCPQSYEKLLRETLPRLPLQLYIKSDAAYLRQDASMEKVISRGAQIIKINEWAIPDLIHKMMSYETRDGFNTTYPLHAIGYGFSRRYAYYIGTPPMFEIEYLAEKGDTVKATIKGITYTEIIKHIHTDHPDKPPIQHTYFEDVAYLCISSFQPSSQRSFNQQISRFFKDLCSNGTQKLILDLRGNGGGYPEASNYLLSYLISESIFPYQDEYALVEKLANSPYLQNDHFFKHFNHQKLVKEADTFRVRRISNIEIKPKDDAFLGSLVVLLDGRSASTTGELLGLIKSYTPAIFIGEEAGGNPHEFAANDLLTLTLPNSKINVQLPMLRTIVNTRFVNDGHGVRPDMEVIQTINDLLENHDPVLKKALSVIVK